VKKKILILASWYPSDASPVNGIFIQEQARTLSREHEVVVLAPRLVGWREIIKRGIGPRSHAENRAGIMVYRERVLSLMPRAPALAYPRWVRAARRSLRMVLRTLGKPDLIHAHVVLPAGWAAVMLGKEFDIPVVLTEHSSPFAIHLRTVRQRRWVKETLSRVNAPIAVSPSLAKQITDFQKDVTVSVIGDLVKTDFFVPIQSRPKDASQTNDSTRSSTTHFLSIALLSRQKGLSYLLHAAKLLIERGITAFDLTIGGDGVERPALERLSQSLGLTKQCRFAGLLNQEEVRQWMQQCDVFIMPSLHETFCIVLGEAMACGKPVIATRCGGPEFVVTPETGVLVDVANPEALANAMSDFILRRTKYDPTRIRQSVVSRFGDEVFLRNVSAVYEKVRADAVQSRSHP